MCKRDDYIHSCQSSDVLLSLNFIYFFFWYQCDWRSVSRTSNAFRTSKNYSNASDIHSIISLNHPMSEWNKCICLKQSYGFCNDSTWLLRSIQLCGTCSLSVRWLFLFDSSRTVLLLGMFSLVCFEHSICYYGNIHQYNAILFHLLVRSLVHNNVDAAIRTRFIHLFDCSSFYLESFSSENSAWKTLNHKRWGKKRLRFLLQLIPNEFYNQFKFVHSTMLSTTATNGFAFSICWKLDFEKWKEIKENWETFWRKPITKKKKRRKKMEKERMFFVHSKCIGCSVHSVP